ncbi:MAG: ubiquitin-like domain-containing protein [Bacillota bacterium]|nr:ubiquitin-like domain-containing protein [Bacillota bacterium]
MKNLFSKSLSRGVITFASLIVFAAVTGFSPDGSVKSKVAPTLNGKQKVVRSNEDTVRSSQDEQKGSLRSLDCIFPMAVTNLDHNLQIAWKQTRQVEIVKDNEKKTVWTTAATVAELLKEQKITLKSHDEVFPKPSQPIKAKMKVRLIEAQPITLVDGGNLRQVWSTSTTVADLLKQQGITLNNLDRVEPSINDAVKKNDVINIIRVEKVTDVVEEPVQFGVVSQLDPNLEKGTEKTLVEGVNGVNSKEYEVILENGKEVVRRLVSSLETRSKQDRVVAVGAKEVAFQASRGQSSGGQDFYVNATAYTANCNGCSGNTATGINLRANPSAKVIAVDPRIIPLGTKVYVDGYGYAVAGDTGGAIKGYKIDVFFSSNADAYRWGNRKVKITILN